MSTTEKWYCLWYEGQKRVQLITKRVNHRSSFSLFFWTLLLCPGTSDIVQSVGFGAVGVINTSFASSLLLFYICIASVLQVQLSCLGWGASIAFLTVPSSESAAVLGAPASFPADFALFSTTCSAVNRCLYQRSSTLLASSFCLYH